MGNAIAHLPGADDTDPLNVHGILFSLPCRLRPPAGGQ
jgi:hypothetical protein